MKNLANCRSLIRVAVIIVVIAFMASSVTDTYAAQGGPGAQIAQHDADIKADIATHDTDIKGALEQHDTDIKGDIVTHDENMAAEHEGLAEDIDGHDTGVNEKLDQILLDGVGGDCPDCPDAWSKQLENDRFVLVMPTEVNPEGEAVLDKETCLVWEQSPDTTARTWTDALSHCFKRIVGDRKGWRLPTIEELATLVDDTQSNPALPSGHPFDTDAVQSSWYWSSTTNASDATGAWYVNFNSGNVYDVSYKGSNNFYVWCVRGGQGHDAY